MPEGWQLKRLRELATFAPGGSLGLTMSDYRDEGFDAYSAEGQNGKVAVAEFDGPAVVVSSIGSLCGKSFLAEGKFTTLANVQVVFPKQGEVDPYFLWNLLNAEAFWPRAQTGQPFIRPSDIKKAWIPLPLPLEQSCMAELFRSVDFLLAKVQAELAAARRLKTALMQQLFTRGIPGRHTRFKQTKIGLIPEEWDLKRGRECFQLGGYSGPAPAVVSAQGDSLYLKVDDFNTEGNETVLRTATVRFNAYQNPDLQLFPPGAIVFAKRGAALLKNRVRILGVTSAVDPNLMVMLPKPDAISTKFLFYFLAHFKLGRLCEDAGIPQLNNRDLYPKLFPVPSDQEQQQITGLLETADETIRAIDAELKAVRRLKTSLLQNLLTGKVRIKMEG